MLMWWQSNTTIKSLSARGAWIEIWVSARSCTRPSLTSLSARGAWIEIYSSCALVAPSLVALRKGSVDRNFQQAADITRKVQSLSARGAWIEIPDAAAVESVPVSLSARGAWIEMSRGVDLHGKLSGRSPQGERG